MRLLFLPMAVACTAPEDVSYSLDVEPVLEDHCFACHDWDFRTSVHQEMRVGRCFGLFGSEEGVPAVVPGDRAASGLWKTIRGRGCGSAMPRAFDRGLLAVDPEGVELIGVWIEEGALDN